jgi:hypothetical protein
MNTYCKPFKRGHSRRTQNYASNPGGYNPPTGHTGNDEAAPTGTPVHAAGDGVIEYAGTFDDSYHDNFLWLLHYGGNIIVLNCGDNEPSFVYAHLDSFTVKPGQRVTKAQVIGYSGNTGAATTGPHLHVEAIPAGYVLNSPNLGRVNPDRYLTEWPEDVIVAALAQHGHINPHNTPGETDMKPIITLMAPGDGKIWATVDFVTKWHVPDPSWIQHYLNIEKAGWIEIRRSGNGPEAHIQKVPAFGAPL